MSGSDGIRRRPWQGVLTRGGRGRRRYTSFDHFCAPAASARSKYRMVAVVNGLQKIGHAVLPLLVPDHREPFDVGEVFNVELDVFPSAPVSQPWKSVISNSTRNFPCCRTSRSNSGTKCS